MSNKDKNLPTVLIGHKEKSLPGKVITGTSRASIGGGALLIGLALFLLFRGFGPGGTGMSGSGTSPGEGQNEGDNSTITASDVPVSEPQSKALVAPDQVDGGLTDDEKKSLSGDTFTVLIDERSYFIAIPGQDTSVYRPTPLKRILELATLSKGDSNGIKVKILRRESARASAEAELKFGLEREGIRNDAIIMPGDFIP